MITLRNILILLLLTIPGMATAQNDMGALGDVKYSILDPDKFRELNGSGWVVMKGQDISGSGLDLFAGIKKLPDARGTFIRSMNLGNNKNLGDSDGNRKVGSYQVDNFQGHKHFDQKIAVLKNKDTNNTPNQRYVVNGSAANQTAGVHSSGFGKPRVGKETRPRNIVLYTYIKIN